MITTQYVKGSPSWIDIGAPDIAATARFYEAVFGWTYEETPGGGYGFFRNGGKVVAGIGALTEEGAQSAWTIYFHTDDTTTAAKTAEQAGGAVRAESPGGDYGQLAQLTDPQGGRFAVWQPGAHGGMEQVDEAGSLGWVELMTPDLAGAKQFYGELFGWQTADMPMPGDSSMTYTLITPQGLPEERMHGGIVGLPADALQATGGNAYWHPVFGSADCDATVAKVTTNGGSLRMGPENAEGVGRLAVCTDQAGAEFVVLTPAT
ncbi:MAG TPA: VOC family protein [Streptomyces sp.]|nr:VOC family protein [Streptomyces sp.]